MAEVTSDRRSHKWVIAGVGIAAVVAIALWAFYPVDHLAHGSSHRNFTMDVKFDKFRQIMVRKNATAAIVAHSGMRLLDEKIEGVSIEAEKQDRPILRALLGKADAELTAVKEITVSIDDPRLDIKELTLTQHADVQPESMQVQTSSAAPAGNLESYSTELSASANDQEATQVELTITQSIQVSVPRIFSSTADRKVQQAADDATSDQEKAIRDFILKHADQPIILPELK